MTVPTTSTTSDPSAINAVTVFRTPAATRYLSLFVTVLIAILTIGMIGAAIVLFFQGEWTLGAIPAVLGVFMAALDGYVLRDLLGRWGLRVELQDDHMVLDLPSERSLIHRPKGEHLTVPYADIAAVETRLEAYPSMGMANMQRAYVLVLKGDKRIFLFEDRAIGTPLENPMYGRIATAILERAKVPLNDLGMVQGRGGVLCVWGTHAPDWAAPSLPLAQQMRLWRHVMLTGSLAMSLVIFGLLISSIARL